MEKGVGQNLYDDAGDFGLFKVKLFLILGIILATCLISSGVVLVFSKDDYLDTQATVVSSKCREYNTKYGVAHNCMTDVKYTVDGKEYTGKLNHTTMTPPADDSIINIRYDPTNPQTITNGPRQITLGFAASCIAIIILVVVGLQYYFASRFKIYRAGEGMGTFLGLISAPFRY